MTSERLRGLPGALFGSAVSTRAAYEAQDAAIRAPVSTARRIGVMSLTSAPAATAVAVAITRVLAARRSGPLLVVDPGPGGAGPGGTVLGIAHALGRATTPPDPRRGSARTSAAALAGLDARDGVAVLHPPVRPGDGDVIGRWLTEAAPIARFFDVSVTDFGARHPLIDLAPCAAVCDVVCLVGDAERGAAEELRAVAPAVAALPETPAPVVVLLDHTPRGARVAAAVATGAAWPVVRVPVDRTFAGGRAPRRLATTRALLRLAALLVSGARPDGAGASL